MRQPLLNALPIALLLAGLLGCGSSLELTERPSSQVVDVADLLAPESEARLEATLAALRADAKIEIFAVALSSTGSTGVFETAEELFQQWHVGVLR